MRQMIDWILRASTEVMLSRFERGGGEYRFVDTKFDIVTGRDFGEGDEPFRRRDCIYSWIQGRGLESLAKHADYFVRVGEADTAARLRAMLAAVAEQMEELRRRNGGRLPFAMHQDGSSFFPLEPGAANFSDLFYSKGLFAAGRTLGREDYRQDGRKLFLMVVEAVRQQRFRTDQQSFDPKNQVQFIEGKFPQGPRMIALGGVADFLAAEPEEDLWADCAEEFIQFIFNHHVNTGRYPELRPFDFIESLTKDGVAWRDGMMVFSDPGHALEFTGLAGKCLLVLRRQKRKAELVAQAGAMLPEIFRHVFDYGFNPKAGGIAKGFDLTARKAVNSDMPWWSLPETVRAGVELMTLYPERNASGIALRAGQAFQAFVQGFLQPSGFGCQTRDENGRIVNVIPAVSDADPGYHTNLSLMDALELLDAMGDG